MVPENQDCHSNTTNALYWKPLPDTHVGGPKKCPLGAVLAAGYQLMHDFDAAYKLGHEVLASTGHPVTQVNDGTGHAAVLALFDEVIAAS
jgi:hypothetical protein